MYFTPYVNNSILFLIYKYKKCCINHRYKYIKCYTEFFILYIYIIYYQLNRTSMHYGYLLHGRSDVVTKLVDFGGSSEVKDVVSRFISLLYLF